MKQFWIFSLWLSLASCLMGCQEDETAQTAQRWGYLSLPDVSVQVENLNLLPTRTASDEDPLTVEIRQGEEVVKSYASDALPEKIELEPGFYTLCVYNDSHGKPWVALGTPDYFYTSENAFEIKEGETNMLETIRVPMVNFGVRLQLPDEFNTWFPNYTFTVQVGEQSVTLKDQETAYFDYTDGVGITYTLQTENTDGDQNNLKGSYGEEEGETVKKGTVYVVTYNFVTRSFVIE